MALDKEPLRARGQWEKIAKIAGIAGIAKIVGRIKATETREMLAVLAITDSLGASKGWPKASEASRAP